MKYLAGVANKSNKTCYFLSTLIDTGYILPVAEIQVYIWRMSVPQISKKYIRMK